MVILKDNHYLKAVEIVLGNANRDKIGENLYQFLKKKYGVEAINYTYENVKDRQRLGLILKSTKDCLTMYKSPFVHDPNKEKTIIEEFIRSIEKIPSIPKFVKGKDFVSFYNLQDEAITDANWKTDKKYREQIEKQFKEIWKILPKFTSAVVFYQKNEEIMEYANSGLSHRVASAYRDKVREFDKLGYIKSDSDFEIKFDSKENLDKNYKGSLFNYSRR